MCHLKVTKTNKHQCAYYGKPCIAVGNSVKVYTAPHKKQNEKYLQKQTSN